MQRIRKGLFFCTLSFFLLFLSFGNFLRLIESSFFPDGWLVSEAFLYLLSFMCAYFIEIPVSHKIWIGRAVICVFCSFFWGYYSQGWDTAAALYALRFSATIFSIYSLFRVCYEVFLGKVEQFFSYLSIGYTIALVLGFLIYIFFPESDSLWMFLEQNHVGFYGDPHIGRFVSVYFDPNYYAVIGGLIFLISCYLYAVLRKKRYVLLACATSLSVLLSWSRSGIALFLGICLFQAAYFIKGAFLSRKRIYIGAIAFVLFCCSLGVYLEEARLFLDRVIHFLEDDSSLYRWETFQFGLDMLQENPYLGVGINFLQPHTVEAIGLNSLDSSLLSLIVQIGIIPFMILGFYLIYKSFFFFSYKKMWEGKETKAPHFFSLFWIYGLGVILFASQFNNLLFYPFWIFPFGVTALFLQERCKQLLAKQKIKSLCIGALD